MLLIVKLCSLVQRLSYIIILSVSNFCGVVCVCACVCARARVCVCVCARVFADALAAQNQQSKDE